MTQDISQPIFPPGHFIQKLVEVRGWSQADLAAVMNRPVQVINELIAGKRSVTPETAVALSRAFGNSVEQWLQLEAMYQASQLADDPSVALRAQVYVLGPIQEITRRKWIAGSKDAEELARQVVQFYELADITETPRFDFAAARKSLTYETTSLSLVAWLHQCRHMARQFTPSGEFSEASLERAILRLKACLPDERDVGLVPKILDEAGLRFVAVEHLSGTRVDGACFWLEDRSPVIAMSMRYERIDYFWHTLFHELAHVHARDGLDENNGQPDVDLPGTRTPMLAERPPSEVAADRFAAEHLIDPQQLQRFIKQNSPRYSRRRIIDFSRILGVHPGIVVGQLQYRGEILYSHSRDLLVSVRNLITASARTDGWTKSQRRT